MRRLLDDLSAGEIRKMRESGMSNYDIAKSLDVSEQTIYNIIGKQGARMDGIKAFVDGSIGGRIKEERAKRFLTQSDLERMTGVTFQMISRYENGKTAPNDKTLQKIADALGVDVAYLKTGKQIAAETISPVTSIQEEKLPSVDVVGETIQIGDYTASIDYRKETVAISRATHYWSVELADMLKLGDVFRSVLARAAGRTK